MESSEGMSSLTEQSKASEISYSKIVQCFSK